MLIAIYCRHFMTIVLFPFFYLPERLAAFLVQNIASILTHLLKLMVFHILILTSKGIQIEMLWSKWYLYPSVINPDILFRILYLPQARCIGDWGTCHTCNQVGKKGRQPILQTLLSNCSHFPVDPLMTLQLLPMTKNQIPDLLPISSYMKMLQSSQLKHGSCQSASTNLSLWHWSCGRTGEVPSCRDSIPYGHCLE